jgi:hypothetical protein
MWLAVGSQPWGAVLAQAIVSKLLVEPTVDEEP